MIPSRQGFDNYFDDLFAHPTPARWYNDGMTTREVAIARLVRAVQLADDEVAAIPQRSAQIAAKRRAALARLVDALGGNGHVAEAARLLGWPQTTAYRVLNSDTTASRKERARHEAQPKT